MKKMIKNNKKIALLVLLFILIAPPGTYALQEESGHTGSLSIKLEKRLFKPFKIDSYKVFLDGKVILRNVIDDNILNNLTLDDVSTGTHKVVVKAVYIGSGYGIFDYHEKYKYPVRSETEIDIKEGSIANLKITFNDNDSFLKELEKRPFIDFEKKYVKVVKESASSSASTVKASNIKKVLLEKGDNQINVHIVGDGYFEGVSITRIDKPERIVIDVPGVKELLEVDQVMAKSPYLDRVRVGQHPQMSRVVLDIPLKKNVDYEIEKTDTGMIVTIFDCTCKVKSIKKKKPEASNKWTLTDVVVEKRGDSVEILFSGSGKPGEYSGNILKDPQRIIVDVKSAKELLETNEIKVNSRLLKSIRIGQDLENLRLVLDIPENSKVDYKLNSTLKGLVLSLSGGEEELPQLTDTGSNTVNYSGELTAIAIETGSIEVEISLIGKGSFENYKVIKYNNPDRIVVDLPRVKEGLQKDEHMVNSSIVNKVRIGEDNNNTRVVIDLESGADAGYEVLPSNQGLVVSVFQND